MSMIRYWYRSFVNGISNLWYYLPVIWKDRQWDNSYAEDILRYKLNRMYKFFESDLTLPCDRQEEYNKALRLCIKILERRHSNWYCQTKNHITTAMKAEERDMRLFFRLLDKYFECWWD